jgi:hypothetical protein
VFFYSVSEAFRFEVKTLEQSKSLPLCRLFFSHLVQYCNIVNRVWTSAIIVVLVVCRGEWCDSTDPWQQARGCGFVPTIYSHQYVCEGFSEAPVSQLRSQDDYPPAHCCLTFVCHLPFADQRDFYTFARRRVGSRLFEQHRVLVSNRWEGPAHESD